MNQRENPVANGRTVLLVEDDPDHITIAQHYLKRLDGRVCKVESCRCLRDAALHIRSGAFELVLLDLTLPDSALESTIEAIEELSKHDAQIVAMSSLDVPEIRQQVRARGAAAFLSKTQLNSKSLTDLLDQLDAPEGPSDRAPGPSSAADEMATSAGIDGRALASKLAHDANSWLANATFRVAALRHHEGTRESSTVQEHLTSISTSLAAIASIATGSQKVLFDEITPITLASIDLNRHLPKLVEVWCSASPQSSLKVQHSELPAVTADETALSNLFAIFASNALMHGDGGEEEGRGETIIQFAQAPSPSEERATLVVTDEGGPWTVANPERITDPTYRGHQASAQAGLGLYRAKRWMDRMGGSLEVVPREDVRGAFAVHLHFLR